MRVPLRPAAAAAALSLFVPAAHAAPPAETQARGPVLAVFAHPDDERVVGPLLARLAREGREVHLAIATDGSKGIREHAGIPAGPELAAARAREARCAAERLGLHRLHLIGLEDGALGTSMTTLAQLRTALAAIIGRLDPETIITFGPEGGTGHPDHRLVGSVATEIVQGDRRHAEIDLLYASLPAERLRSAPPSVPGVTGVAGDLLTVRVRVEEQDIAAARGAFACHATQYTPGEMDAINRTLAHVWDGMAYLRPWNGSAYKGSPLLPPGDGAVVKIRSRPAPPAADRD